MFKNKTYNYQEFKKNIKNIPKEILNLANHKSLNHYTDELYVWIKLLKFNKNLLNYMPYKIIKKISYSGQTSYSFAESLDCDANIIPDIIIKSVSEDIYDSYLFADWNYYEKSKIPDCIWESYLIYLDENQTDE